jgi:glyoxylate reductase
MPSKRPRVIVTRRLPDAVEARLASLFEAELSPDDRPLGPAGIAAAAARCEVLVPTLTDKVTAEALKPGGSLGMVASFGAGTDHIDLEAARAAGIVVANTPDVLTDDTADLILSLILSASRGFSAAERLLRAGGWTGWAPTNLLGRTVTGKMLAIVGLGRIGRAVGKRAAACGMIVHYHNRSRLSPEAEAGAVYRAGLDAMLAEADVLALCCPYTAETHALIDGRRLALMKRGAFLVNAARGQVVDEEALIAALASGALGGAGLDVYPNEPEVDPRLIALPNTTLLPHLGSATVETRTRMGEKAIENILAWAAGEEPPNRVA